MANQADTRIKTILSADADDFEAGVKRATRALADAEGKFKSSNARSASSFLTLGNSVKGLAAYFSVREIAAYGKKLLENADQLQTLSERTGVAAKFFSALQPEIENAGGNLDDFAASLNKMNINLANAFAGDKGAEAKFKAIGVSIDDLRNKSPDQQFLAIATAISRLDTEGQRAAGAVGVFGKGVVSLLPSLSKGGDELERMADEAVSLGLALDDETVARLDDLGDSINTLGIRIENFSAKKLIEFLDFVNNKMLTGIAENFILLGKAIGAIDPDVAREAIRLGEERANGPMGPQLPKQRVDRGRATRSLLAASEVEKGAANAEKLAESLDKLSRKSQLDLGDVGLSELGQKLREVDYNVESLADQYKTKLTPAQERQVDAIKANLVQLDKLNREQQITQGFANDLGSAFGNAFDEAADGATKFGDIMKNLGSSIRRALMNATITQPVTNFFTDLAKGGGGTGIGKVLGNLGSSIGSIFGLAGGGDIGPNRVTLVGENGPELLSTRSQGQIYPNHALDGGGMGMKVIINNNAGAKVSATPSRNSSGGTDLIVMIDKAVADNIVKSGSMTKQALDARDSRVLTKR